MLTNETREQEMIDVLVAVIKGFTRFHADIAIEPWRTPQRLICSVRAHADDVPKIIGTGGVTVRALGVVGSRMIGGTPVVLSVMTPTVGRRMSPEPFRFNKDYNADADFNLLTQVARMIFVGQCTGNVTRINSEVLLMTLQVPAALNVPDSELDEALNLIWTAIGKANGYTLSVEVNRV